MKCTAYFTIEATLLIPIVFLFLWFLIYLGFYQYDRCLFTQDTYILAMTEAQNYSRSNAEMYRNIMAAENDWEWENYISFQRENMEVEIAGGNISITAKASVKTPFRFPFLQNEQWGMKWNWQAKIRNPVFVMRSYKKLEHLFKGEK